MQPISSYSTATNFLRLVLQGPPGAGKTVLACQFPKPVIVDVDVNLGGPLRFLQSRGLPLPVGFITLDRDDNGVEVPLAGRYQRMNDQVNKLFLEKVDFDTLVIDSATKFIDVLIAETLRQQNKAKIEDFKDPRQFWNFFGYATRAFFEVLTKIRKHIVLNVHERINKNTDGSVAYPIKVNWPGQYGAIIGAFFTDVWRAELDTQGVDASLKVTHKLRTMPDFRYELKNSLGLPPLFDFNWQTIQAKLNSTGQ